MATSGSPWTLRRTCALTGTRIPGLSTRVSCPETQEVFPGNGLNGDRDARCMVSQERATAQLDKD